MHRIDPRVAAALFHTTLLGDVIAHRIALQKVTIVAQQRIRGLAPHPLDQGCST
jgi:hypothetical protein